MSNATHRPAFQSGLDGIRRGMGRMSSAAHTLSREVDPEAMVDMKLAETEVAASVKVVRSVDETLGTLLDELA